MKRFIVCGENRGKRRFQIPRLSFHETCRTKSSDLFRQVGKFLPGKLRNIRFAKFRKVCTEKQSGTGTSARVHAYVYTCLPTSGRSAEPRFLFGPLSAFVQLAWRRSAPSSSCAGQKVRRQTMHEATRVRPESIEPFRFIVLVHCIGSNCRNWLVANAMVKARDDLRKPAAEVAGAAPAM